MGPIDEKIEKFAQAALTGLLANQAYVSPQGAKYLEMKGITLEGLAIESAIHIVSLLKVMKEKGTKNEPKSVNLVTE